MKKLASILFALVMLMSMATTAFAASVTLPSEGILAGHTFTAYQIFSGREEGDILSDVTWGSGIKPVDFLKALQDDATCGDAFDACTDAASVAQVLNSVPDESALAYAVAKVASKNLSTTGTPLTSGENQLADGYYLVVDTSATVVPGSAYNAALLQVVGDISFNAKTDAPSVEKKVLENVKYNQDGGYGEGYNDVADYTMGEAVPFRLIGSVPNMAHYDTYKYIFHDTLSAGLTLNSDSIAVYGSTNKAGTDKEAIPAAHWAKDTEVENESFTVSFADLKTVPGISDYNYIIVEYTAKLNQNAVVGLPGNPNEVYLQYSNKPDQSGAGDNKTGNTPEDKVIVFTYELDTTKVDGATNENGGHNPLQGAEFKLKNAAGKWAVIDANGKITGWEDAEDNGSKLTSGPDGLFKVIGLDDGTYFLKETKAPAGYNMVTDLIEVVITATTSNGQNWTNGNAASALTGLAVTSKLASSDDSGKKAGTVDTTLGIASITVVNNKGVALPETGGIGTSIFYTLGATLMLCAGVLLVTKKRMAE